YISSVECIYEDGAIYTEAGSYHLLDASREESLRIRLKDVHPGTIKGIRFNIGVDSTACVSGALEGDLDPVNGMYWAWNSGYINAKLEGRSNSCSTLHQAFEFHIGGYLPKEKTLRKTAFNVEEKNNVIAITADVSCWFSEIRLQQLNSVVIPGAEAGKMADRYKNMFSPAE
ncbi:MAG: MbnP family protein, partial [Bacteroidia bacterium]